MKNRLKSIFAADGVALLLWLSLEQEEEGEAEVLGIEFDNSDEEGRTLGKNLKVDGNECVIFPARQRLHEGIIASRRLDAQESGLFH